MAIEFVRAAFAAVWLPFTWAAMAAAASARLLRRSIRRRDESVAQARFSTAKWTPELLKHLEWRRFEELCAAYFEQLGFRVDGASLYPAGQDNASAVWQCKAWNAYPIGIKPLRELHGAMAVAGTVDGAMLAAGRFTPEARAFAAKQNIQLIDGAALLAKLSALAPEKALGLLAIATKGDFLTPTCPSCSIKMTARKSTGEGRSFWGCPNYPRCKLTFNARPG